MEGELRGSQPLPRTHSTSGTEGAGSADGEDRAHGPSASATPIGRRRLLILILALVPFLLLAAWHWDTGPERRGGDYAQYLLHAEALAEGREYSDIGYIFTRLNWGLAPPAFPPGLPLTLAPVLALVGRNMTVVKTLMLGLSAAFVLLGGVYFTRHHGPYLGLAVALLLGLSPRYVHFSLHPFSDPAFAALLWAVILLMDEPGRLGRGRIGLVTLLTALALLYRPTGVMLIPAFFVYAVLNYRRHGLRPAIPGAVFGIAILAGSLVFPERLLRFIPPPGALAGIGLPRVPFAILESHLYPLPGDVPNDVYHVVSLLVMAVGLVAFFHASPRRFAAVFAVVYGLFLLALPWDQTRYAWPLFPVFVFGLVYGAKTLASRLRSLRSGRRSEAFALALAGLLAATAVFRHFTEVREPGLVDRPEVRSLFGFLESAARGEEVRVSFVKPRVLTWETGVPAMPLVPRDPRTVLEELCRKRISHVVVGDLGLSPRGERAMKATVEAREELFRLEFRNEEFVVYSFARDECTSPGGGPASDRPPRRRSSDGRPR